MTHEDQIRKTLMPLKTLEKLAQVRDTLLEVIDETDYDAPQMDQLQRSLDLLNEAIGRWYMDVGSLT